MTFEIGQGRTPIVTQGADETVQLSTSQLQTAWTR